MDVRLWLSFVVPILEAQYVVGCLTMGGGARPGIPAQGQPKGVATPLITSKQKFYVARL